MLNIYKRYVHEEYRADGLLNKMKVQMPKDYNFAYDVVDEIAKHEPDRPAMVWLNPEGEHHTFTYEDLKFYSDKTANYLADIGVEKGDLVLVILRRHYQFWFVALALNKLGATIVPATFMLKEHDVIYRVNAADISTVICTDVGDIAEVIDSCLPKCPTLKNLILVAAKDSCAGGQLQADGDADGICEKTGGQRRAGADAYGICEKRIDGARYLGWSDFNAGVTAASSNWTRIKTCSHDAMIVYFTSGTSGNPKMAMHDYSYSIAHLGTARHWQNVVSDGGLHFTIADTGWGKAVWGKLYGQFLMEACVLTYDFDRFDAGEICSLIETQRVTTLCCPPTMYRMILQAQPENYDLSSLRYCVTAGEALNPDVFQNWQRLTGLMMMEGFGQTETTVAIANITGMIPKAGSMGKPVPLYDVHILNEDGEECAAGKTGEICIRCPDEIELRPPGLLVEYFRDSKRTAAAIHDGWYHTGDTAWADEDGYFWYVGRNDDVIKSSGYRISPFEIESVMLMHPAVRECAITAVPDELRGSAVKATVVLQEGYNGSDELTRKLQDYMKRETAPYKYPRIVNYVNELPKTVNGKVRRAAIRASDEQELIEDESGTSSCVAPEECGG
ncbi:MAG: AMP-binding protein [Coriobacteriales bacterium]|jgi:acetyl-CoA synthetase|nr:AMP-binding protein [Coriobacteriales bacterium]